MNATTAYTVDSVLWIKSWYDRKQPTLLAKLSFTVRLGPIRGSAIFRVISTPVHSLSNVMSRGKR